MSSSLKARCWWFEKKRSTWSKVKKKDKMMHGILKTVKSRELRLPQIVSPFFVCTNEGIENLQDFFSMKPAGV